LSILRVLQVAVALGLLIFVHELGHFLAAKWAGVRVEVFSFGFGPFLFSFRKGETIYAFSLIPLGGYVRMTGQSDSGRVKEEEKEVPHSYLAKSPGKRAVIIVAGVTMNVIFAFVLFAFAYMAGICDIPSVVGEVPRGSPAYEAGLAPGDRVLSVDGSAVARLTDVSLEVATRGTDHTFPITVRRPDGSTKTFDIRPRSNERGIAAIGVMPVLKRVRVGVDLEPGLNVAKVEKDSPAAGAGLLAWDYIETVDGKPFEGLYGFKAALREAGGAEVTLGVRRGKDREWVEIRFVPKDMGETLYGRGYQAGFNPGGNVVKSVVEGSGAAQAGVRPGDVLAGAVIMPDGESARLIWVKRGGEFDKPRRSTVPVLKDGPEIASVNYVEEMIAGGFLASFGYAAREGVSSLRRTYNTLFSLLSSKVPAKEMTSIIGIAVITYRSTTRGLGYYLWLVAFISINLAVINLVPMMPLDGGLLVFLGYEALRGRQASTRVQEIAQVVGMVLILALIIFVLKNDIVRFWGSPT
jgi:regulator of sigma E protease